MFTSLRSSKEVTINKPRQPETIQSFDADFVKDRLEFVICLLVDDISSVSLTYDIFNNTVNYRLSVSKNDIGKVIGKSGKMADSLKTILNSLSSKRKFRSTLSILE
jgi:predicted RNA-binding protein YlqC (UPF0109 family)